MNEIELKLRENRRKRMNEDRLREGYYLVSYNYDGDGLSDYRSTMLVKANSEGEALKKARDKKSDGRHFEIDRSQKEFPDGYVDSLDTWRSKYPKSNYDIAEAKDDSTYDLSKITTKDQALTTITNLKPAKSSSTEQWLAYSILVGDLMRKFNLAHGEVLDAQGISVNDLPKFTSSTGEVAEAHDLDEYSFDSEEDDTNSEYKKLRTKSVMDSDGFYTDYTLYKKQDGTYICIFGDNEYYTPEDTEPDFETEDESEAIEWFDSYTGFEDDFDESKNKKIIRSEHTPMSTATKPQINEASQDDEDDWDFDDERHHADEETERSSNWKRLKDLQGDFWTNLDELVEDIEDQLGYEVVFKSREYLSIIDPDAEDDAEYKLSLGGTERTIVVELDRSYPM